MRKLMCCLASVAAVVTALAQRPHIYAADDEILTRHGPVLFRSPDARFTAKVYAGEAACPWAGITSSDGKIRKQIMDVDTLTWLPHAPHVLLIATGPVYGFGAVYLWNGKTTVILKQEEDAYGGEDMVGSHLKKVSDDGRTVWIERQYLDQSSGKMDTRRTRTIQLNLHVR